MRNSLIIILAGLVVIGLSIVFLRSRSPDSVAYEIPEGKEVKTITATVYGNDGMGVKRVPAFNLPEEFNRTITKWLQPPFRLLHDFRPLQTDLLGQLTLTYADGSRNALSFYWTGNEASPAFSMDSKHFYVGAADTNLDGGLALCEDIARIWADLEKRKQSRVPL